MNRLMVLVVFTVFTRLNCLGQSTSSPEKPPIVAQAATEKAPKNFYQLNFVVRELENEKVINSRLYSMIMRTDTERASVRAGEKLVVGSPVATHQIDVGVSIDCRRLEETSDRLSLAVSADVTSLVESAPQSNSSTGEVIRTNRWESTVSVSLKQPTILFSSDDPSSKRKMQLQLTVTPFR